MRVKRGFKARRRRNRILKHAEGYFGSRSRLFRQACEVVHHGWQYAYKHRKERKREFRALWISRIGAAAKMNGTSYSRLVHGLGKAQVALDRKILADIAVRDPAAFQAVCKFATV
jgi:large subunit ribosomal protein L20